MWTNTPRNQRFDRNTEPAPAGDRGSTSNAAWEGKSPASRGGEERGHSEFAVPSFVFSDTISRSSHFLSRLPWRATPPGSATGGSTTPWVAHAKKRKGEERGAIDPGVPDALAVRARVAPLLRPFILLQIACVPVRPTAEHVLPPPVPRAQRATNHCRPRQSPVPASIGTRAPAPPPGRGAGRTASFQMHRPRSGRSRHGTRTRQRRRRSSSGQGTRRKRWRHPGGDGVSTEERMATKHDAK